MSAEAADSAICVTVFASSTPQTSPKFAAASEDFGRLLAQAGGVAIFGGGNAGCMGAFYDGARKAGGRVRGITHRMFVKPGGSSLSEENAVELESLEIIEGRDLTMRKRRLLDAADCLVALPGGVGTFDELYPERDSNPGLFLPALLSARCSTLLGARCSSLLGARLLSPQRPALESLRGQLDGHR